MSLRLPEPGSFERRLRPVRVEVAGMIRLSRAPDSEPYWSAGLHRFDDPEPKLGLNNDISATNNYAVSQAWARAINAASPRWDGIRYVSRQMNRGYAYAIFNRSRLVKLKAERLEGRVLDELCDRFNVAAV